MKCFSLQTLCKPSWWSTHLSVDAQPGFICAPTYSDIIGHEGQTPVKVILSGPLCSRVHTSSQKCDRCQVGIPRKSAPSPVSPHYLLHTRVASIQDGDPQLQSLHHHGAHLTCRGEDAIESPRKQRANHTWALAGLFNNDFRLQCDSSVVVTGAHSETTETTFAGAYHLKDHLCSSTLMQPSLLIESFLLFHFFLLDKTHKKRSVDARGIHGGELCWERSSLLA